MAQAGFTPILLYASGTATNVPLAADLTSTASGAELALNYADGKLYYKNSSGVVTLLAGATAGPAGGSDTQIQYNNSGVLAGNAAMTFNSGTSTVTLTGFSTLVKTLTLGNSSFNGTAVFAAATPAKLYLGTGTVTDVTSAISATNTTGAIASLAITPIAATNTGVTYTNASTLYIAGAPSAGTNITITNPYSLYVAAGAVNLGGNTAVTGTLSTTGAVNFTGPSLTLGAATVYDAIVNTTESMYFNVDSNNDQTGSKFQWGENRAATTGGTTFATLDVAGLAVTGTLSATGNATLASGTATTSGATIGSPSQAIDGGSYLRLQNSNSTTNWQISANLIGGGVLDFTPSTTGGGTTFTTPRMALSSTGLAVTGTLSATSAAGTDKYIAMTTTALQNTVMGFNNSGITNGQGIPNNYSYFGNINAYPLAFTSDGALIGTWSTTGLAVTGTLSATGYVTSSGGRLISGNAGLNDALFQATNTGGTLYIGLDNSGGGFGTAGAYGTVIYRPAATAFAISRAGVVDLKIGTSGTLTLAKSQGIIQSGADGYLGISGGSSAVLGAVMFAFGESHATDPNVLQFRNSGNTTRMTLDASGNLLVGVTTANANGGVLQLKSGITFPATAVAATDANTLDDYEEGTFTPALTNFTIGNGSAQGRYTKIGHVVTIEVYVLWGSTTSASGAWSVNNLPFTSGATQRSFGSCNILDSGTENYWGGVQVTESSTTLSFLALGASATYTTQTSVTASVPMTWTTNDAVRASVTYTV